MKNCIFSKDVNCRKIHSQVDVNYFWGKRIALGKIIGISSGCMCIHTEYCIPLDSRIELLVPFKGKIITLFARVSGYSQTAFLYDTMHVTVLNASHEVTEFMNSIEKRKHERIRVALEAAFISQEIWSAGFIRNISEYGLNAIIRPEKSISGFYPADILVLKLDIPSGENLNIPCRRVWTRLVSPHKFSMNIGVEIQDPPTPYRGFLKTFH